jgi:hypothetical protein
VRSRRRLLPLLVGATFALVAFGACTRPPGGGGPTTPPGGGGQPGAQTKTVRYGPFNVPGKNQPAVGPFAFIAPFLGGQAGNGMMWNQPVSNVAKPCTGCAITKISADLKNAAGQSANVYNGLWLHHMVLLVSGSGKRDSTCPSGLHQTAVGRAGAERLFASGNERTVVGVGGDSGGYGYRVNAADQFHLIVDLMNENEARTPVTLELTYEYTTAPVKNVKPLWMDANGCGVSEVPARPGAYTVGTNTWTSNVSGQILHAGGHLHDGGTNMTIERNGQPVCDSVMKYGTKPEWLPPDGGMDHDMPGMEHGHSEGSISEATTCYNMGPITSGQRIHGTGYYDEAQHPHMVHDGKLHNVMAIALVYIGLNN